MKRIKVLINRILITVSAYFRCKRRQKDDSRSDVLIVFQQVFGDAVVVNSSLNEYCKLFPNRKIRFLARPAVISFIKDTMDVPPDLVLEMVDFKRFLKDFHYYHEVTKRYSGAADVIIVPGTSLSAEIFTAACDANRKVGLIRTFPVEKPVIFSWFYKNAYDETVVPDRELMMYQRHRLLLHYLGETNYKARLSMLKRKDCIILEEKYAVMCPGASQMEKCWPIDRFTSIADYIIENYDMNVHLCGGSDEAKFESYILDKSKFPNRIISHIGSTSFSDWSSIVQYAALVVGNDSATMHLAASSLRKAVCIAGVYDKFQFFPYKVDEFRDGDRLPKTIIKDMPCEWCRTIGYMAGYGNHRCRSSIVQNKCALCIEAISVEEVERAIDELMVEE